MSNARGETGECSSGYFGLSCSLFAHKYEVGQSNQAYLLFRSAGQALTPAPGRGLVPSDVCR